MTRSFMPTLHRTPRLSATVHVVLALVWGTACGGTKRDTAERKAADTAARAPGGAVVFSAAEVRHGGVRWAPAAASAATGAIEVPGQLVANEDRTARLGAPARGRIVAVHVQLGDRVERGQPLATLQSAEASAARADHEKAAAALASRRAAATYARAARERAERLLAVKAIARQDVERARADDELARSELAQAEAEVERTRTSLAQLGVSGAMGEMVLRSPLSGVVIARDAVPGAVVDAGAPLVAVTDPATLWLEVAATDRVASSLRAGMRVRFAVPAFAADTFEARVQSVGGAFDPATRTLPVRALARNTAGRLRPEMYVTAWIDGGGPQAGVAVPAAAVQLLDEVPVVFVAHPDGKGGARFERRAVEIGANVGATTHVVRGLSAGEVVVTDGAFAVKSEFVRSKMAEG